MTVKSLFITGPRQVSFRESEEEELGPNDVRVKTLYSGISHGTEMNVYRGDAPMWKFKQDRETKLFVEAQEPEWKYPMKYGYANVGRVEEVGADVTMLKEGDTVFSYQAHETGYVIDEKWAIKLPGEVAPEAGIFIANMNTAFNGILDAGIRLYETVVVFGQGVIGQITAQLAKLSGARPVIVVDLIEGRLEMAKKLGGADFTLNPTEVKDVAMEVRKLTENRGADVAIELSASDKGLNEAIRTVGYNGKVVVLSWYPDSWANVFPGAEFHHNRVSIIGSQVGGIAPELSNRWTIERRMKVVLDLLPQLKLKELITDFIPFDEAPKAYEKIDKHPEEIIQVVLKY